MTAFSAPAPGRRGSSRRTVPGRASAPLRGEAASSGPPRPHRLDILPSVDPRLARRLARFNNRVSNRLTLPLAPRLPGLGVVAHVGRRSGRTYRTPVNVFSRDGGFVFALPYGRQAQWVQNVLQARAVRAHHARNNVRADQSRDLRRRDSTRRRAHRKANAETREGQGIHAHGRCRPRADDSLTGSLMAARVSSVHASLRLAGSQG